jgi:hypothetical protein
MAPVETEIFNDEAEHNLHSNCGYTWKNEVPSPWNFPIIIPKNWQNIKVTNKEIIKAHLLKGSILNHSILFLVLLPWPWNFWANLELLKEGNFALIKNHKWNVQNQNHWDSKDSKPSK